MIVLSLEIWPGGDRTRRRKIGHVSIANVSNFAPRSKYDATFTPYDEHGNAIPLKHTHARVDHVRDEGVWKLVRLVLDAFRLGS